MRERIISAEKSIIWAADVEPKTYFDLAPQLGNTGLGAVKIGFEVGLGLGLRGAVDEIKSGHSDPAVIYDHQKAGNDIPDTAKNFARAMQRAEVDAAILFPFTGKDVEERWVRELQDADVGVIVGSEMTHPGIEDRIKYESFRGIFDQAIELGVSDFVVPGNKPERVKLWKNYFDHYLGDGNFDLYAPGFISQGGEISESGKEAGKYFHAIVGRGIHNAENPTEAAGVYIEQLREGE